LARHGEVGPRRGEPRAGWLRLPRRPQAIDQRDGEIAAGAVAADRDVFRRIGRPIETDLLLVGPPNHYEKWPTADFDEDFL